MEKHIVQSCDCDITKRMIEAGVIFLFYSQDKDFSHDCISLNLYNGCIGVDKCFKCGQPLRIEMKEEENSQQTWKDLPEHGQEFYAVSGGEAIPGWCWRLADTNKAINLIGRKLFGEEN